jgi:hypothetical protein
MCCDTPTLATLPACRAWAASGAARAPASEGQQEAAVVHAGMVGPVVRQGDTVHDHRTSRVSASAFSSQYVMGISPPGFARPSSSMTFKEVCDGREEFLHLDRLALVGVKPGTRYPLPVLGHH